VPESPKFPVIFPDNREFLPRDGFAADWLVSHVPSRYRPAFQGSAVAGIVAKIPHVSAAAIGLPLLLPAFYLPMMLMLFALILRGISFAFWFQTVRFGHVWDFAFAGGSLLATFAQGLSSAASSAGCRCKMVSSPAARSHF
jgi:hypothetical protein